MNDATLVFVGVIVQCIEIVVSEFLPITERRASWLQAREG